MAIFGFINGLIWTNILIHTFIDIILFFGTIYNINLAFLGLNILNRFHINFGCKLFRRYVNKYLNYKEWILLNGIYKYLLGLNILTLFWIRYIYAINCKQ